MTQNFIITAAKTVNSNSLQLLFNLDWYQEDTLNLSEIVFDKLEDCQILEKISGADKEYVRFIWHGHAFIINFECYSESCWIEHEGVIENNAEPLLLVKNRLLIK